MRGLNPLTVVDPLRPDFDQSPVARRAEDELLLHWVMVWQAGGIGKGHSHIDNGARTDLLELADEAAVSRGAVPVAGLDGRDARRLDVAERYWHGLADSEADAVLVRFSG